MYIEKKINTDRFIIVTIIITITAQCTLVQSAVLGSHVVRLSICNVGGL